MRAPFFFPLRASILTRLLVISAFSAEFSPFPASAFLEALVVDADDDDDDGDHGDDDNGDDDGDNDDHDDDHDDDDRDDDDDDDDDAYHASLMP